MQRSIYILFIVVLVCSSCSDFTRLLKSKDYEEKYVGALRFFEEKKYAKAQSLLEDVTPYFRGTERSEDVLAYTARCCMGQKDYASATEYYQTYIRSYPKGKYVIEARFMAAHACYMDSPDARLDQQMTRQAIQLFTEFVELYPDNDYTTQAYDELDEMYNKLAHKEYLNAKLYYNLGTYLGNNYLSCEIVSKNALKDYPSNEYQEEFNWLIFASKYQEMVNSFEETKLDRAREAEDEYYNFSTQFPDSKHQSTATKMSRDIEKTLGTQPEHLSRKEQKKESKSKEIEI